MTRLSRRDFIAGGIGAGAALLAAPWLLKGRRAPEIPGAIVGASSALAHRLRQGGLPEPGETLRTGTAIVGGGIAGLSAGWWLQRSGYHDFTLLELEGETGGNARSGSNAISAYPWGAHYLPLPGSEAIHVRQLLEELGVIKGYDPHGLPWYDDYFLCAAPQERLFVNGRWQDGLLPGAGASGPDQAQARRFFDRMDSYKALRGSDGYPAFSIPVELSSRDPELLALDRLSMGDWMTAQGYDSSTLRWYVDYCCRDDYGCGMALVSAWAGIHYFASRRGQGSGLSDHPVLAWPEGNGWLARRLREKLGSRVRCGALAFRAGEREGRAFVDCFVPAENRSVRIEAEHLILATPRFVATRLLGAGEQELESVRRAFSYSPWMVANLSLDGSPPQTEGAGVPLSWDNVLYDSRSLGYVVATHQRPAIHEGRTVLTYYQPLDETAPAQAREASLRRSYPEWRDAILADLRGPHPGIDERVSRIDVWLWGHGMIRPSVGFIWGEDRRRALASRGDRIHFAHSDMSGISIFEEAQYRGVQAARAVLA